MRRQFGTLLTIGMVAGTVVARSAGAQLIDLHTDASVETERHSTSWGGGLSVGTIFIPAGFAVVGLSAGADYIREQHLGAPLLSSSIDVAISPSGGSASFAPYVGGSAALNWSGGEQAQWTGARQGLDAIAGIKSLFGGQERVGWKLEGRFGYIRGYRHAYSTRLGLLFGL
jgi:hypothetical protein